MIQGTSSSAGKSMLVAGLCRIFAQSGYRVAPFKAQNMALNSFVTADGEEMGRAQVTQACAAFREPDARMNPILLKPASDTRSQVVVNGKPLGTFAFHEYRKMKGELKQVIGDAYRSLARDSDIVIIEGAGSPAEINLKDGDLVNMAMARTARSPVLIVGDIDRGGVFAQFVGTLALFDRGERTLTKGFIINKFRGDASLLEPGIKMIEKKTKKPVLGVVPFLPDLKLPDEDSVEYKSAVGKRKRDMSKPIQIALVDLPHISNHTDFDPFLHEDDVALSAATDPRELAEADLIILPGTKNVIGDFSFLEKSGLAEAVRRSARGHKIVIGICGGLQMLGEKIDDPHGIESRNESVNGLGLLQLTTVLGSEKRLRQVKAHCPETGESVFGYEIHHGVSDAREKPFLVDQEKKPLGWINPRGNVWGTYVHGVFDNDSFRRYILNKILAKKNLPQKQAAKVYSLNLELDKLAAVLKNCLALEAICKIAGVAL
jgi:adenosylcobyric acid synthase